MRPPLSVVSLALVLVATSAHSYVSGAGADRVSEKEAILKVVQQYVEAYNQRDVAAIRALFDKDADIVTLVAAYRSLEEIERFFDSSMARGGTIRLSSLGPRSLRFLRPDVAILDVGWETTGVCAFDGKEMPPLHRMGTFVLAKNRGRWVFSAMRLRTYTISKPKS